MRRRLKWAMVGGASCAAAALVAMLMVTPGDQPGATPILVPQAEGSELAVPKPPGSSVSALPPLEPVTSPTTTTTTPPVTTTTSPPAPPTRQPVKTTTTTPKPVGVDFQAEDALIRSGSVGSNHPGFTGTGFVDTDNTVGSSVQWSVNASRTGMVDVIFRFANGSGGLRPMDITVNGILVATINFPATDDFDDYRTIAIRVNLLGGANKIKATSSTNNGGPNLDKITIV